MKTVFRWLLSALLLTTGTLHIVHAGTFVKIMPPLIPWPMEWVIFTGLCELAAAVGLQIPHLRRLTAWLLVVMLICVFPANIQMALHPENLGVATMGGFSITTLAWLRLPLQLPLIAWAAWYTRPERKDAAIGGTRVEAAERS